MCMKLTGDKCAAGKLQKNMGLGPCSFRLQSFANGCNALHLDTPRGKR
jgi:hypothetical protein